MSRARVIPVILLNESGMVKTKRFRNPTYIGDPINAVKIFNDKETDEIIVLDIDATRKSQPIKYDFIAELASEAFMPVAYGGGIHNIKQMERLFKLGVEKLVVNSALYHSNGLLQEASRIFGSQSIVASVDVKKNFFGNLTPYSSSGETRENVEVIEHLLKCESYGAGEIVLNSIDRDGQRQGFDLQLISTVSKRLKIPVVALGGAGGNNDLKRALECGASAVAAGSMFVFHGRHDAVLITYTNALSE